MIKEIDVSKETQFEHVFDKNTEGSCVFLVKGKGKLNFKLIFEPYSNWNVLWVNQSDTKLEVEEVVVLKDHVSLKLAYAELTEGFHTKSTSFEMVGAESSLHVKGASLVSGGLLWDMKAHHLAKGTKATLNNHAIVLRDTKFKMEVTGQIEKGYSQSETHQMTRVLNLGEKSNAIVYPKLLIDENDVAASHAASVGRPNIEHLYYLMSRGIKEKDAYRLILRGYLLPITEDIEDGMIKNALISEIETKVERL